MASFYPRTGASRIIKNTNLQYTGSGTVNTTAVFDPQCYQVRVFSTVGGWISIDNTTGTGISSSTGGVLIAANTAAGDYFGCTPGQSLAFSSSSTSSGTISVTQMGA